MIMKELAQHGLGLSGTAEHLRRAGTSGKWASNVERDMVRALKRDGLDMVAHPNSSRYQAHGIRSCTFVAKVPIREVRVPMLNNVWEADREERLGGGLKYLCTN